jgi:Flp pilus assembly protein TadD
MIRCSAASWLMEVGFGTLPPLQAAAKLEPRNPGAHYNLATALTRAGRKQEAEKEFAIHRQMTQKGDAGQGAQQQNPN